MDVNHGSCGSLGLGCLLKLKWVGINLHLVIMPVEVEEGVARLVIVLCSDLRVHPSECNK
jgi:hypothetical protein